MVEMVPNIYPPPSHGGNGPQHQPPHHGGSGSGGIHPCKNGCCNYNYESGGGCRRWALKLVKLLIDAETEAKPQN
jgi:hypothetical protein